jgi:hypothetical protein
MIEKNFDFAKFIEDSKNTLLKPKEYFPALNLEGGLVEPIIKGAIYGAVAGFLYMLWSFLHIGATFGAMWGGASGIGALFFGIFGGVIGVFVGGIITLIISAICGGNTSFEANVRVAASIMVIYPVSALLTIFSGYSYYLGTLIGLAVNLYTLYLLYIAITTTLKGSEKTAKTLAYILAGLIALFLIIGVVAYMGSKSLIGYSEKKIEQKLKELEDIGKEMEAEYEKSAETLKELEQDEADTEHAKPEKFPADACDRFKEKFSSGNDVISTEKLQKVINATEAIQEYDNSQSEEILKTLQVNGFETTAEYASAIMESTYAIQALNGLVAVQAIMDSSDEEKKAASMFTLDRGLEEMVNQMIAAGKLTESDMRTLYDNWDLLVKIDMLTKKKN